MKSINSVPALPISQDAFKIKYSGSIETESTEIMKEVFPKHANKKNRNETPSHDFL